MAPCATVILQFAQRNSCTLRNRSRSTGITGHDRRNTQVTYRGLTSGKIVVADTTYKSSDLQVNQAIKAGINNDAVLSKLLIAQDGPGNTLVITSLTDGTRVVGDLDVAMTASTTAVSATDAAAYLAANPLMTVAVPGTATSAEVLADMAANAVTFNASPDYTNAFAVATTDLVGVNSETSTDNTVTPGTGNDVIVLSTTNDLATALASSNETVVFAGEFGNDTIVNFNSNVNFGEDKLNFTSYLGTTATTLLQVVDANTAVASTNSLIVVATKDVTGTVLTGVRNDSAAEIAKLYTDDLTANKGVYITVDTATNIGSVYQVVDGTAAADLTVTLVGTIDLADTLWSTLTQPNFS